MRDLPPYQPPQRPTWILGVIWVASAVAVLVAVVWGLTNDPAGQPEEPYCITYLECPVDTTP